MRRKEREITDKTEIDEIIRECQFCFIGMCDEHEPYVVPISFGYDGTCFYFHSAFEGRKVNLLKNNETICISMGIQDKLVKSDIACKWTAGYRSLIVWGKAIILEDYQEKLNSLKWLMKHYSDDELIFTEDVIRRTLVFKVKAEKLTAKKSVK